jgi:hypothetical protein
LFPSNWFTGEELVYKFHEETSVLKVEVFDTKPSISFASLDIIPCHKTFGAMANIFTSPEESPATAVNRLDDSFRRADRRHEVEGH